MVGIQEHLRGQETGVRGDDSHTLTHSTALHPSIDSRFSHHHVCCFRHIVTALVTVLISVLLHRSAMCTVVVAATFLVIRIAVVLITTTISVILAISVVVAATLLIIRAIAVVVIKMTIHRSVHSLSPWI